MKLILFRRSAEWPANKANKDAARVLLMKCYLNKPYEDRSASTFSFNPADMNKVINLADRSFKATGIISLAANYFDNFAPDNTRIGTENILHY
jgi:hypothetical protein